MSNAMIRLTHPSIINNHEPIMDLYDPLIPPDPAEWLEMDEGERIMLARDFHEHAKIDLPNVDLHATIHTVVENQIAMGDETPVAAAVARFMLQGLNRHEAIHAVASAFTDAYYVASKRPDADFDLTAKYYANIRRLKARQWKGTA